MPYDARNPQEADVLRLALNTGLSSDEARKVLAEKAMILNCQAFLDSIEANN